MTVDKHRKRAARELAASQGISYTEARRRVEAPPRPLIHVVTDSHTGWTCAAGASLLAYANRPGAGTLPDLHAVIYVCAEHRTAAEERIAQAGYDPQTEDAPPGHRWDPWPCGHITGYRPTAAATFTGPTEVCLPAADLPAAGADDDVLRCRCGQQIADTAPYGMCGQCRAEEWDDD